MIVPSSPLARAAAGIATLQQWYNFNTGLWDTAGWWQSANVLTVVADYAAIDPEFLVEAQSIFQNTYIQSQKQILPKMKAHNLDTLDSRRKPTTGMTSRQVRVTGFDGFLNEYYDDEGWWALAWLKVYDLTNFTLYLQTAMDIFDDMTLGWDDIVCGGIWWDKPQNAINAISNELFLSVAAQLANRAPPRRQYYLDWALKEWSWFQGTGMINSRNTINDGIDLLTCQNNLGNVWSYNQGVILGALVELNNASPDPSYIDIAVKIANAAIIRLSDAKGIIHESCEPECGADGPQFKGIFMRNLQILQRAVSRPEFEQAIIKNAESIWANNRDIHNRFGLVWSGPFDNKPTAATHSSACDALIAAASFNSSAKPSASSPPSPASISTEHTERFR
ncbi:MAG: hypothetical protein Q9163_000222 [Psora crenata]